MDWVGGVREDPARPLYYHYIKHLLLREKDAMSKRGASGVNRRLCKKGETVRSDTSCLTHTSLFFFTFSTHFLIISSCELQLSLSSKRYHLSARYQSQWIEALSASCCPADIWLHEINSVFRTVLVCFQETQETRQRPAPACDGRRANLKRERERVGS